MWPVIDTDKQTIAEINAGFLRRLVATDRHATSADFLFGFSKQPSYIYFIFFCSGNIDEGCQKGTEEIMECNVTVKWKCIREQFG